MLNAIGFPTSPKIHVTYLEMVAFLKSNLALTLIILCYCISIVEIRAIRAIELGGLKLLVVNSRLTVLVNLGVFIWRIFSYSSSLLSIVRILATEFQHLEDAGNEKCKLVLLLLDINLNILLQITQLLETLL